MCTSPPRTIPAVGTCQFAFVRLVTGDRPLAEGNCQSVALHEGAQHLRDRPAVVRRVMGYAFEGVDRADPYFRAGAAQLLHGCREALGDLPLAADFQLPPGEVRTDQQATPARPCRSVVRMSLTAFARSATGVEGASQLSR